MKSGTQYYLISSIIKCDNLNSTDRENNLKHELDYSGAKIKMPILQDVEYVPHSTVVKEDMKETQEFLN